MGTRKELTPGGERLVERSDGHAGRELDHDGLELATRGDHVCSLGSTVRIIGRIRAGAGLVVHWADGDGPKAISTVVVDEELEVVACELKGVGDRPLDAKLLWGKQARDSAVALVRRVRVEDDQVELELVVEQRVKVGLPVEERGLVRGGDPMDDELLGVPSNARKPFSEDTPPLAL